jgi:hypothetical protein
MARRGMQPWGDPGRGAGRRPGRGPAALPASSIRLTDAERDEAVARLSEHYAVGRLDKDEFDERSDAIWTARTGADLAPIFADLEPATSRPGAGRPRFGGMRVPLVPVLFVLIALTVITHVPFVMLAFVGGFFFVRRGGRW